MHVCREMNLKKIEKACFQEVMGVDGSAILVSKYFSVVVVIVVTTLFFSFVQIV
jgi:hypothetical protein